MHLLHKSKSFSSVFFRFSSTSSCLWTSFECWPLKFERQMQGDTTRGNSTGLHLTDCIYKSNQTNLVHLLISLGPFMVLSEFSHQFLNGLVENFIHVPLNFNNVNRPLGFFFFFFFTFTICKFYDQILVAKLSTSN